MTGSVERHGPTPEDKDSETDPDRSNVSETVSESVRKPGTILTESYQSHSRQSHHQPLDTMPSPDPIDFDAATDSNSWQRACEQPAMIETISWDRWLVSLADGDDAHLVQLHRDHGAFLGHCTVAESDEDCPGWKWHDGPCAHLCALRRADFGDETDTHGRPIRVWDIEEVADRRAQQVTDEIVATDGGHL